MQTIIIVPGLGNNVRNLELATNHWQKSGLQTVIFSWPWYTADFSSQFTKLLKLIDRLSVENQISLVGTSAGGSVVLNAYAARKGLIHRVVNVCGRLRVGPTTGFRSFQSKTKKSAAFAESVKRAEIAEEKLSKADRTKILTIRPLFGDEIVPPETVILDGAKNITIPFGEHVISISLALTIFSQPLLSFLKRHESQ